MTLDRTQIDHFPSLTGLRQPRIVKTVAWLIVLGILLVIAILFVPWQQTAKGGGLVTTLSAQDRARDVSSLVSGRVAEFYVKDGDHVHARDPIVRVVDVDPDFLSRLAGEKAQIQAQIMAVEQARATAMIDVRRTSQLYSEGLAARRDFEQTQIKVADVEAKLAESRAKLKQLEIKLAQSSAQLATAPRDGRVQNLNAALGGSLISSGTVLATIAPERVTRAVEVYIDGRDIPLVTPGAR